MKKLWNRLLAIFCCVCLIGCAEAPSETLENESNSFVNEYREKIVASHDAMGIIYLGYCEGSLDAFLQEKKEEIPLLSSIDKDHIINYDGQEVYLIIPVLQDAGVIVDEYNNGLENEELADTIGDQLYQSETGDPFVLKANVSELASNVAISISFDEKEYWYQPSISLKDGKVFTPEGVLDLTQYQASLEE